MLLHLPISLKTVHLILWTFITSLFFLEPCFQTFLHLFQPFSLGTLPFSSFGESGRWVSWGASQYAQINERDQEGVRSDNLIPFFRPPSAKLESRPQVYL